MILRAKSPLFHAALSRLGQDPDPIATALLLRDVFPNASPKDIEAAIRETAVTFHCAGVVPAERGTA